MMTIRKKYLDNNTYFHDFLNFSSNFGGYSDRAVPSYFAEYALSRASWTPEQRAQIRQILLLLADYCEGDDNQPHHSMLSRPSQLRDGYEASPALCRGHLPQSSSSQGLARFFYGFLQ